MSKTYSISITTNNITDDIKDVGKDIRNLASDLNPLPNLRLLGNKSDPRPDENMESLTGHIEKTIVEPVVSGVKSFRQIDLTPYYASGPINDLYRDVIRTNILSDSVGFIADHQNLASEVINSAMSNISGHESRVLNTMHIDNITRREVILVCVLIIAIVLYKYFYGK